MTVYGNGQIPLSALTHIGAGKYLRADAAASFVRMAAAFRVAMGFNLSVTDAYRSLADQIRLKKEKGSFAATPGKSNHGLGLAVDLGSGVQSDNTPAHRWMDQNAGRFGWSNPAWAQDWNPNNGQHEPWHWEYNPARDVSTVSNPTPSTQTKPPTSAVHSPEQLEANMPLNDADMSKIHELLVGVLRSDTNKAVISEVVAAYLDDRLKDGVGIKQADKEVLHRIIADVLDQRLKPLKTDLDSIRSATSGDAASS